MKWQSSPTCIPLPLRKHVTSNNAFERAVGRCGPRLAAARSSWPAAQLGR
jgi:hypothetical protein